MKMFFNLVHGSEGQQKKDSVNPQSDARDEDEDDIQSVAEDFDDSLHHRQIQAELPTMAVMINPRQSMPFGTLPGKDNYSSARKEVGSYFQGVSNFSNG